MSSAQRVAAVHHELRRRYMAGFPKWIAVLGLSFALGSVPPLCSKC